MGGYGDPIITYPKPYSIYLGGLDCYVLSLLLRSSFLSLLWISSCQYCYHWFFCIRRVITFTVTSLAIMIIAGIVIILVATVIPLAIATHINKKGPPRIGFLFKARL